MQTFGGTIRKIRIEKGLPLRKVAAMLDIDQSLLSKIERNEKITNKELVVNFAKIFEVDEKFLLIQFYSDKVAYDLSEEDLAKEILLVAEEKVKYLKENKE